jgi:diguanylate cyclase (GGDEF)-like protein
MTLDTFSIAFVTLCITVVNAMIVSAMAIRNRNIPTLAIWAISIWCLLLGTIATTLRLFGLDTLSIFLTNLLVNGGIYLVLLGYSQFIGHTRPIKREGILFVTMLIAIMIFHLVVDSFASRVVLACLFLIYSAMAVFALRRSAEALPFTQLIMSFGFGLIAAISLIRILVVLTVEQVTFFNDDLFSNASYFFMMLGTWMYTYAMVIAPGEKNQNYLARLSERDVLTQTLNRRAFITRYDNFQLKENRLMAVALIDLDHFKSVNDTYGHLVGDEVLKTFCLFVKETKRSSDIFARLGGEEFALFFEEKHLANAHKNCDQLRARVERHFKEEQPDLPDITISIGLATSPFKPPVESLLFVADEYLYKAKQQGRNRAISSLNG